MQEHPEEILWKQHPHSQIQCRHLPADLSFHHVLACGLPILLKPVRIGLLEHNIAVLAVSHPLNA